MLVPELGLKRVNNGARHDDRDRTGCRLRSTNRRWVWRRDNDINVPSHKLGNEIREPFVLKFAVAVLNDDVLSFDIPKLLEPLSERTEPRIAGG